MHIFILYHNIIFLCDVHLYLSLSNDTREWLLSPSILIIFLPLQDIQDAHFYPLSQYYIFVRRSPLSLSLPLFCLCFVCSGLVFVLFVGFLEAKNAPSGGRCDRVTSSLITVSYCLALCLSILFSLGTRTLRFLRLSFPVAFVHTLFVFYSRLACIYILVHAILNSSNSLIEER